jgi:hypothetical protein
MRGVDRCRRLAMFVLVLAGCGHLFLLAASEEPSAARRLSAIEVIIEGQGLVVSLAGDGPLRPTAIREAEHWPPRLVVDLPDVISGVPGITPIGAGPIEDIRVVAHSLDPLVTRVVFELRRSTTYEITEPSEGSSGLLTFVFPLDVPDRPDQDVLTTQPEERSGPRVQLARAALSPVLRGSAPRWVGRCRVPPPVVLSASPILRPGQTPSGWPMSDSPYLMNVDEAVAGVRISSEPPVTGRPLVLASDRNYGTRGVGGTEVRSSPGIHPAGPSPFGSRTAQLQQVTQGAPRPCTVTLTVFDDKGQVGTATASVVVRATGPTASFLFSPTDLGAGSTVFFDGNGSDPGSGRSMATYRWNFGDGLVTSPDPDVGHTYTTAGTYDVQLTVTNNVDEVNTTSQTITVTP